MLVSLQYKKLIKPLVSWDVGVPCTLCGQGPDS